MAEKFESIKTKIQDSVPLRVLFTIIFAAAYIVTDPTLSSTYFLYFTYRMQTLVILANYTLLAAVYGLTAVKLIAFYRNSGREKNGDSSVIGIDKGVAVAKPDYGMLLPYILFYIGYLIATLANPETGSMVRWSDSFFFSLVPLLIAFLFCSSDEGKSWYVSTVSTIYLVLAILNIVFCFFPQLYIGEGRDWREEFFLGFENKAGWPLMMGAFFSLVDWKLNGRIWKTVLFFAVLLVNIRLIWCITALIGTTLILFYFIFPFLRKWAQRWDFLVFVGIVLFLFCCLMFFQKYTVASEPVGLFIEEVFKKKRNLSGRLPIWELGVAVVMQKPWLGVGAQLHPGFILWADEYGVWSWYHAHNEMLQTWYEGGLLTLAIGILLLAYAARRFRSCKELRLCGLCKMMLFVFLLLQLSDDMPYYLWYMTTFVAHVSVLLCSAQREARSAVTEQTAEDQKATDLQKDRDLLAEQAHG